VISVEDWALVRRLVADGVPQRQVARDLGIGRSTVARALASDRPPKYERPPVPTSFTPFELWVRAILHEHPDMPATVIAERVGWTGSITWFRDNVRRLRPEYRRPDPADRLIWAAGDAAQCDLWFPPRKILLEDGSKTLLPVLVITAAHEEQKRGFIKKRLTSLGLTLGAIIFMVIMLGIVAVLPPLLKAAFGTGVLRWVFEILGWLVLVVLVAVALAILYRLGTDRDAPRMAWVSVGAIVATVLWLVASIWFLIYTATFGNYAKTYGVFRRNCGAAVLAVDQHVRGLARCRDQCRVRAATVQDTTKGEEEPLGDRVAVKADSVPSGDPEAPQQER